MRQWWRKIDETYKDTWEMRDKKLKTHGYNSYGEYLKSDEWKKIKIRFDKREKFRKCYICKSENNLDVHHKTYKAIAMKNPYKYLFRLCRDCHNKIHEYAKANNVSVRIATNVIKKNIFTKSS